MLGACRTAAVDRCVGSLDRGRRPAAAAARRRRSASRRGGRSRLGTSAGRGARARAAQTGDQRDRCAAPHEPRTRAGRVAAGAGYSNLELDLATGRRGSRHAHAATLIARACDAEAAIVVNNGASAVLLVLAALARDREVLVSRGEAVEIGGGFRVPEVMAESGARLVDVGTTNRTRLADYERALARKDNDVALDPEGAPVELPHRRLHRRRRGRRARDARAAARRRHRFGLARRRVSVADGRPASVGAGRARREADARSRRGRGHVLRRQAARRTAGRRHRRARET